MTATEMKIVAVCLLAGVCLVQESSQLIIRLERDFGTVQKNEALAEHVAPILARLETFKVPVHPRLGLFYEVLRKGIVHFVHRTSDTLYNINKYNDYDDNRV